MSARASDEAEEGCPSKLPDVQEVIEQIGLGPAQFLYCLVGGAGLWFADGTEMLLISGVTKSISVEWSLGPWSKGLMTTSVFAGMLAGSLAAGAVGDNFGRRLTVLLSYGGLAVFSFASSFATDITMLGFFRVLLGIAMGVGIPAWTSLSTELTSAYWRYLFRCLVVGFWSLGEMYACMIMMLDDPAMDALHWRRLFRLCSITPMCLLIIGCFRLPQSPSWLAVQGRYDEAAKVLEEMRDLNGQPDVSVKFRATTVMTPTRTFWAETLHQLAVVFGRRLRGTSAILIYFGFVYGFTHYGGCYAFPQMFAEPESALGHSITPATQLLCGSFSGLLGVFLAFTVGMTLPRKSTMSIFIGLNTAALMIFSVAGACLNLPFRQSVAQASFWAIKLVLNAITIVETQYASEVYPTEARITGIAMFMAANRSGGMIAPLCFEALIQAPWMFFAIIAVMHLVAWCLVSLLPFETLMAKLLDKEKEYEDTSYGTLSK